MSTSKSIKPRAASDLSDADKISFLKQPAVYPHPVAEVEVRETHMSWIFLAGNMVYKIKKPVAYRFLDFRSLEARFKNCREEVRLNKRLARDIYYGVVALVLNEQGKLQLEGKGPVVEWLVKMKRIPEENFLDHAIRHQKTDESLIKAAGNLLAEFYHHQPGIFIEADLYQKKLEDEIVSTYIALLEPLYCVPVALSEMIRNSLVGFLHDHPLLFQERIAKGKIIEAHGDLKPEHICLVPRPAIIDALEFSQELRIMDVAEELSFLDIECEVMGDLTTGKLFFDCHKNMSGDSIPDPLIYFYKAKKAFLRAYLVARHITEPGYASDPKWLKKANAYLLLAKKYTSKPVSQI